MVTKITNGKIISDSVLEGYSLYFKDDKILDITKEQLPHDKEIDADGNYISAGFIDVHLHGGGGYDFMDGGKEPIEKAANFHLSHGTTSLMPTTLSCSAKTLASFLEDLKTAKLSGRVKNNILGAHIEGPYVAPAQAGAQNPEYIKAPDPDEYITILKNYSDIICRWSFAPELEGSVDFCKQLLSFGVSPSVAHSNAVYEDVKAVYDVGCRTVTHLYSSMSSITRENGYRRLGVIESAYLLDDITVEVIADGKHLPKELLKLVLKCKPMDKICLVTDAMRAAGTEEYTSFLGRRGEEVPCVIEDSVAKLPDKTSFAGSIATADRLVRTMVKEAGLDIAVAVSMITKVPSNAFGIKNKGELRTGFDADIVIFDNEIKIKNVIVGGKEYGNQNL